MSQLTEALDEVVTALRDAGVTASTDATNLHGPAAWVTPHDVTGNLAGNITVRAAVYLIAPARSGRTPLALIGQLLDQVADVLTLDEPAQYVTVSPPGASGADLPALRIITSTD